MHTFHKCLFVALAIALSIAQAGAQVITKSAYTPGSREQMQVQYLVDHSINYAETMLVKQGAYAPYAAALTVLDSVVAVEGYTKSADQQLIKAIADLKSSLKAGADKGLYKAVVVYFDVTITDPDTKMPTDAIAAYTEQMNSPVAYTLYFPYKKTELKTLTHTRTLSSSGETEIFTKVTR